MAATKHVQPHREERTPSESQDVPHSSAKGEKLKHDLDEILDEIDEVLEDNAEAFVKAYVQKGGQ